jgi:hypothetical protein
MVLNEKNLMRTWDVAFNGYNGGCDDTFCNWKADSTDFRDATNELDKPYDGPSIICMIMPHGESSVPNPILLSHAEDRNEDAVPIDPENINSIFDVRMKIFNQPGWKKRYQKYANHSNFPDFSTLHATRKTAGANSNDSVTEATSVAFQGTISIDTDGKGNWQHTRGAGHLGESYVGVASVREGKGFKQDGPPAYQRLV